MSRIAAMALALVVLVTGCTRGPAVDPNGPTMTKAQALDRVDQLIKETAAVLDPKPTLEVYEPSLNDDMCLDGGSKDRIVVNRSYYLRNIPKEQVKDVARQVKTYWEKQGHRIESMSDDGTVINGRSIPDDFLISLGWSPGDVLDLAATSYCIWPNGTPEPSAKPSR